MIWLWLLLATILCVLYWRFLVKPYRYWSDMGIKQSKPIIIFGDMFDSVFKRTSLDQFILHLYNMHPTERYSGLYQFFKPTLMLRDPDLIKQITIKDFDHFVDHRSFIDPESEPLWEGNLFALKGKKWREMRATLSGCFTSAKMKTMFNLMWDTTNSLVKYFQNKNENLIEVEIKEVLSRYTNDVIASVAFGIEVDSLIEPNNTFYLSGKMITNFYGFIRCIKYFGYYIVPWLYKIMRINMLEREATDFFKEVINENIKAREEKGIIRRDMLNLLLQTRKERKEDEAVTSEILEDAGFATAQESLDIGNFKQAKNLSNEEITAQALIFFFAGFDTVSSAMCFGCYELALNQDIQEKLRNEIKTTYEENNGKITYEILVKMVYMDMVVSEILRKWSPAIFIDRVCTKPYTIQPLTPDEKPVHLKVGDICLIPIHAIQRDSKYYSNPDKFDPERFSEENKVHIPPYTYIPFGSGPRNCIGSRFALLETKVLLFNLLLSFQIVPISKTEIPVKLTKSPINISAENGFWLGFETDCNLNYFLVVSSVIFDYFLCQGYYKVEYRVGPGVLIK